MAAQTKDDATHYEWFLHYFPGINPGPVEAGPYKSDLETFAAIERIQEVDSEASDWRIEYRVTHTTLIRTFMTPAEAEIPEQA